MTSRSRLRSTTKIAATASAAVLALLLGTAPAASALSMPAATAAAAVPHPATTPIKHFVFLMQGGRTFDNYFGTYPGADGLGTGTCQPLSVSDPAGQCIKPFLLDNSERAPLGANATIIASQLNGGKMNGFVAAYQQQGRDGAMAMGYYNATQLPFYWEAAQNYVLFDHFFSSAQYGIRNNRSYWVSASPAPGGTGGYQPAATGICRRSSTGCRQHTSAGSSTCKAITRGRLTSLPRRIVRKPRLLACR